MLFIFDWDGTISDSTAKIVTCMQRAAEDTGLPVPTAEAVRDIIGLGLPQVMQRLYPGTDVVLHRRLQESYSKHFVIADKIPSAFYPGVIDTLEQLRLQGHKLAVATGKGRRGLDRVFGNLQLHGLFHASRCADETASKPNPLMLHELLVEFDTMPEDAVMVGDTEYDMEMAQRATMPKIAVSYGAHHIDRLKPYGPVLCVSRFVEILQWQRARR